MFITKIRRNLIHRALLLSGTVFYTIGAAYLLLNQSYTQTLLYPGILVIIGGLTHCGYLFFTVKNQDRNKEIGLTKFAFHASLHIIFAFGLIAVTGGPPSPFKIYLALLAALVSYAFGNALSWLSLAVIAVCYGLFLSSPMHRLPRMLIPNLLLVVAVGWIGYYLARLQRNSDDEIKKTLVELENAIAAEQAFHQAGKALVSNVSLEETLQVILDYAIKLVNGSVGSIGIWDSEKNRGKHTAIFGLPELKNQYFDRNIGIFGQVATTAEPLLIKDYCSNPHSYEMLHHRQLGSMVAIPLQFSTQFLGVLGIFRQKGVEPFGKQHLHLLQTFADLASSAINRANLYEEVAKKSQQLAGLLTISQQIANSLDRADILQTVVTTAITQSAACCGFVCLVSPDGTQLKKEAVCGAPSCLPMGEGIPIVDNPILQDFITNQKVLEFISESEEELPSCFAGMHAQSAIMLPLVGRKQVLGGLFCAKGTPDGFSQLEKDFLVQLSLSAAIAIDNAQLYGETRMLAVRDPLTGLYNQRLLYTDLDRECKLAVRQSSCVTFLMLDVDDFKIFNDCYGHQEGDRVLQRLAEIVQSELRETDLIYRYGGEEFCIILPAIGKEDAGQISDRLHTALLCDGLGITVSIGLATFPDDSETIENIIQIADSAMYRAKKAGKNNTAC